MTIEKDAMMRIVYAQQVQNGVDNPDMYFDENYTELQVENLKKYFNNKGLTYPKIPTDERGKDVVKLMSRVWLALETLDCASALLGGEE